MTIPLNLHAATVGTVAFWRSAAPSFGVRTWHSAMNAFARQHGKAIAILADDGARIVERDGDRLTIHTLSADAVRWHKGA
jgi:hypothetical protein